MKSFKQFISEAENEYDSHDWGVIHPHTGKLISGLKHPTATSHSELKSDLNKKDNSISTKHYADYAHMKDPYDSGSHTLHLRSHNNTAHKGLLKGIKNLPVTHNYSHDNNNDTHEFNNLHKLKNHVSSLIK